VGDRPGLRAERVVSARAAWAGRALLGGLALLLALNVLWLVENGAEYRRPLAGRAAPAFSAPLLDGGELRLAEMRGHPVVLAFWATWCPPCVAEMPDLERLHRALSPSGVRVYAVDIDSGSPDEVREKVRTFVRAHQLTLPVVLDPGQVADRYHIENVPQAVILDGEGRVAQVLEGQHTLEEMTAAMKAVR
jgi:peroxiredoxin